MGMKNLKNIIRQNNFSFFLAVRLEIFIFRFWRGGILLL